MGSDQSAWLTGAADALAREMPGVVEYARRVVLPDGELAGTCYDPSVHPGQMLTLEAIDAGASWVAIAKPVQDGGSLASFVPILRRVTQEAQTAMIAYPTRSKAEDAWRNKIWPILVSQGGHSPRSGSGSRGGVGSTTRLPSGGKVMLRAAGGRHEAGQAADTADVLLCDELDDWENMRRIRLIERRVSRSQSPLLIYVSTVKRDGETGETASRILECWAGGTATVITYPCPHCGTYQEWKWEQVNVEQRRIACIDCGALLTDSERLASLPHRRRKDGRPGADKFSIKWTALDSPFSLIANGRKLPVLEGLCQEYEDALEAAARGDHGFMRQFFRDRLTRPYRGDQITDDTGQTLIPTRNRLAALSAASQIQLDVDRKDQDGDSIHLCHLPAWCEHLTVGLDVQRGGDRAPGRLYFAVLGRGGGRGALVGWGTVVMAPAGRTPSEAELHASLDRLAGLLRDWSPAAPIVRRGVDVGDRQDEIRRWLRSHPDWWAVKGTGPLKAQVGDCAGWIYRRQQDAGWVLHLVETDGATRAVHGEILAGSGVGSLALPHGLERQSAVILHICATVEYQPGKWSSAPKDRAHHPEWQIRHDYLDALAYARALAYGWENTAKKATVKPTQPTEKDSDYGAAVW